MGSEQVEIEDKELEKKLREDLAVDPARYKGIHGTAILSRYPIRRARILRFTPCYDWYGKEKEEITRLEKGKREAANRIFLERVSREVRHGGRMALIAEIDVPESPTGKVTVAAPHIENKCVPACRVAQLRELLAAIKEVDDPVIIGGDMNTTGSDAAPMSVKREIKKRIRNPEFWAGQAIRWLTPIGLPRTFLMPANFFKNYHDPTARHVPLVAPNREYGFFQELEKFRFSDKHTFDFRGDPSRTVNQREKTLGNSNQRGSKGFIPTFAFQRDLKGVLGQFKLDWFFIKPLVDDPYEGLSEWFAPHFPLTMAELNQSVPERVSDHHPITVDLPLTEVKIGAAPAPAQRLP
jgi:endonuclease/exonuclease/phosphatase family metal-dependent hydrolase